MIRANRAALSVAVLLATTPAHAAYDCATAKGDIATAEFDIASSLRRYIACFQGNDLSDDCSSEFRRIKNAQAAYEQAISDFGIYCHRPRGGASVGTLRSPKGETY